jgi:AP-1 complex subunit sigma 1/2
LSDLDDVNNALTFDAADCRVIGGCDVYTTKAAGADKKLYKNIDRNLENQYASLLRLSASLSPPQQGQPTQPKQRTTSDAPQVNLSRSSPFGSLSQLSSRRTFAYLVATLNASQPDYDFSNLLRPSDFRRERSLKTVINRIDSALYNLRPRHLPSNTNQPKSSNVSGPVWGPRMWRLIDKEMDLQRCTIYHYIPDEDPFDGEDGAIWSENYFFFSKARKRVCYIYFRGTSMVSHSPMLRANDIYSPIRPRAGGKRGRGSFRGISGLSTPRSRSLKGSPLLARSHTEEFAVGWDDNDSDYDDLQFMTDDENLPATLQWTNSIGTNATTSTDDSALDDDDEPMFVNVEDMTESEGNVRHIRSLSEHMMESIEI